MKSVPLASRVVATTPAVTGATPSELSVKPISSFTIGADDPASQAAAIIVVSKELLRFSGPGASLFHRSFATVLLPRLMPPFWPSFMHPSRRPLPPDQRLSEHIDRSQRAVSALTLGVGSRVFVAMCSAILAELMTKVSCGAGTAYPTLSLQGGEWLNGIPVIPTTSVPSGAIML